MKLPLKTLLFLGFASVALGVQLPAPGATEEECGRLGIMYYDPEDLPEGVTPEDVRHCAAHPLSAQNYWGWGDYLPRWFP
ncbi:uncharacterized protein ACLA_060960 [Aspergillus clavatus NRRL 1]|uniref:Uncharacterized protein n=1 Tax=Aspergillus clavatus (strain ATCC 1007 / CBS 513.65 / DSM 816 / NCTC 3887 / NRRL 1 / QM 1276 / 107) TaxID=344612 RepID=A1CC79_ASPCL|nr:uncharacterized protein ACLA_060960 [Aspergillus clavatus NRRL 1]EAW12136.1 conserved hypothetical protein [Aspergillus clavatus NRRL 1]